MKKLLPFFLLLSFFLTPTFASASALTRESQLVNQALNSSANTALRDVRVMNGTVTATVDQRVALAGSSAILSQPVSFAADYAAIARSAASLATKMAGGYAAVEAAKFAVKKLLDGVGYVIEKGSVVKKTIAYDDKSFQYYYSSNYYFPDAGTDCGVSKVNFTSESAGISWAYSCLKAAKYEILSSTSNTITFKNAYLTTETLKISKFTNPKYVPNSTPSPTYTTQSQSNMQDAFLTWMQNNPTNITDPVSQAMYTPAQKTGWNLTGDEGAHHGVDGITDEIAKNILDHRNAALQQSKSYTLNDSVQPTTQVTPDGSSTTTTNNPDGSTTKRTTTTTTDPQTGKQTSTTTTTVTQPDGTSKTTTETTTTDATKTKTDIPAACEWFSTACEWFGWTKKDDPITDNPQIDQSDLPTPILSENAVSWGSQCPNPQLINFNLMGQTANIQLSWTPVCTLLSYLYYPILAGAYIAAAYIVIGAYKS